MRVSRQGENVLTGGAGNLWFSVLFFSGITRNKAVWRFASHAHSMTPNIRVIAGIHRCPWLANRRENRDREGYLVTIENALTARHEAGVWSGRQTPAGGHFLVFSCRCAHLPTRDEARTIGVVPIGGSPDAAVALARFYFLQ
jgi:hypothetical protein